MHISTEQGTLLPKNERSQTLNYSKENACQKSPGLNEIELIFQFGSTECHKLCKHFEQKSNYILKHAYLCSHLIHKIVRQYIEITLAYQSHVNA